MSRESVPVSVEYIISTTSDWTTFQIFEGGWWSNHEVEIKEGFEKLSQEIVYNEKTIAISKKPYDKSKIVVHLKCTLNIIKEYFQSNLTYLITKGDIESTTVRVFAEGKEIPPSLVNATNVRNNPKNPLSFQAPVGDYLKPLQVKAMIEVMKEKPKEKVEPKKEKYLALKVKEEKHIITETFNELFEKTFKKKEPSEEDIKEVFEWVRSHGKNANKMLDADIYRNLTLKAETHFWRFPTIKKKIKKEVDKTLKTIRKRYDDLRTIQGKFAVQTPVLGGFEKEEKKVAPNK